MSSVNKVMIIGNLGKDPELRATQNGNPVCSLSVATTEVYKDSKGEKREEVEWHKVTVWGLQAEHCGKYLQKGRSVYVEGKLKTDKYTDKDGVEKYSTGIVAQQVKFLGKKGEEKDSKPDPFQSAVDHANEITKKKNEVEVPF